MQSKRFFAGVVLLGLGCSGADQPEPGSSDEGAGEAVSSADAPVVYVVNYPLAYLAERVGNGRVHVEFPAPADLDPAMWSPGPEVVTAYQAADLILLNGAGYAGWVSRVSLPEGKLIDTSASFADRYLTVAEAVTHSHGPEGEHAHEATAFTTWLDPTLALEQAGAIHAALAERWPEDRTAFDEGLAGLEADLAALDAEQAGLTAGAPDRPILACHPVYQYLAERYGLNLRSVHFEPGEAPDRAGWQQLADILAEHPARWMLWEGEPLPEVRDRLRDLGVESVVYDPAGNRPAEGDYLAVMQHNAQSLGVVFGSGT
jgi:zinc transport system substrate-binding protein